MRQHWPSHPVRVPRASRRRGISPYMALIRLSGSLAPLSSSSKANKYFSVKSTAVPEIESTWLKLTPENSACAFSYNLGRLRTQRRDYLNSAETSDAPASSTDTRPALHAPPHPPSAPCCRCTCSPTLRNQTIASASSLVRVICDCGACRDRTGSPGAPVGWSVTLKELALRMRRSSCNAAEMVAVARPRPHRAPKNPR